eukprot:365664-Chlamydomonas_euryale.AAC.13
MLLSLLCTLMTTRCAGRLTPSANVDVVQMTARSPERNACSTAARSEASSAALCVQMPDDIRSASACEA